MRFLTKGVINVVSACWIPFVLATSLTSVYLWQSGIPQVGDFAILLWAVVALPLISYKRLSVFTSLYSMTVVGFVWYITLVNLFWAVRWSSMEPIIYAFYYIFNALVMIAVLGLVSLDVKAGRRFLLLSVRLAVLVSLAMLLLNFDSSVSRQIGGFNNPNQLGYTSLLLFCLSSVLWPRDEPLSGAQWSTLFAAAIQAAASFSISAILGLTIAGLGVLLRHRRSVRVKSVLLLCIVSCAFVGGAIVLGKSEYLIENLQVRISVLDRKTEDISGDRGYDRILEYPEYVAFGAGEGVIERFRTDKELHSTFGTLIFSYGVPGILLFAAFVGMSVGHRSVSSLLIICGPLIYSLTHQGLRATLLWILLVSMYLFRDEAKRSLAASPRLASHAISPLNPWRIPGS